MLREDMRREHARRAMAHFARRHPDKVPPPMQLLGLVVDKEKAPKAMRMFEGHHVHFNIAMLGFGTASNKILGYLGLGETPKTVFFTITHQEVARRLVTRLDEALDFKLPGNGVVFTSTIYQGCYHRLVSFPQTGPGPQNEGETMEQTNTHDMIMVVLNRGYTEELMDVARAAGATGGTALQARGCGLEGAAKFFGITVQPEKELVMIVAKIEDSCAIMQEIADKAGPGTDVNAVSFSFPVSNVMGAGRDVPRDVAQPGEAT